jgi:glyoxylase-like metal-dependent hydrolase (beta-lactamase superfamily II)
MTYKGHVEPGGAPAVHELAQLIVNKVSVGAWDNNAYSLRCRNTGREVLIDAADEPDRLLAVCGDGPLVYVVTTHSHPDHWNALAEVVAATGAETVAHVDDADDIPVPTSTRVHDGARLAFGECSVTVIHLGGHTPGSIALLYDDPTGAPHLFSGDGVFPGGVGKTSSPAEFDTLIDNVEHKLFDVLPDETWVYPGHGDDTTLGAERPHLEKWRARRW